MPRADAMAKARAAALKAIELDDALAELTRRWHSF